VLGCPFLSPSLRSALRSPTFITGGVYGTVKITTPLEPGPPNVPSVGIEPTSRGLEHL